MLDKIKNKEGGFLQLIIFIIVIVLLMNYFNLTFSGIINWITTMFQNVF